MRMCQELRKASRLVAGELLGAQHMRILAHAGGS